MSAIIINSYRLSFLSLFVFVIGLLFISHAYSQEAEIYTEIELEKLIQKYSQDSILNLERLAAFEFHKLLNEYRASNNLDTLGWNETLWLTCRNHNIYMSYHKELSHSETTDEKYFSGEDPGDRLKYAQEEIRLYWSGENALYNYSCYGSSMLEKANNIAESSFNQWKNSPGHNRNMLSKSHELHGAAFIISDSRVYGTSLFGYPLSKSNYWANYLAEKKEKSTKTLSEKKSKTYKKISIGQSRKNIENQFIEYIESENKILKKQDRILKQCAKKQVIYMAYNNVTESIQRRHNKSFFAKDLAKRIAKAEGNPFWFLARNTKTTEYIVSFDVNEEYFSEESVKQQIIKEIISENNIDSTQLKDYGFYIKLKRKKSKIQVFAAFLIEVVQS